MNQQYDGDFNSSDKVALKSVYEMLMDDPVVKTRLKEFAKNNDANMFIKSIFPSEFQRILVNCYDKNMEAFERLLGNQQFQDAVMTIMAKEFYRVLSIDKKED